MAYRNAANILPAKLLAELQQYVQGEQIYIPSTGNRAAWGTRNGTRTMLAERDATIRRRKASGASLTDIADEFGLSLERVRKIVYSRPTNGHALHEERVKNR